MGFLDRLLGRETDAAQLPARRATAASAQTLSSDELAIERYRYLLRTAPAATIEQVHREAFAALSPEQRALVYRRLIDNAPAGEQPISEAPNALARAATRSELRLPGSVERAFTPAGGTAASGPSLGQLFAGSMLGTIAGLVVGSALAEAFFPHELSAEAQNPDAGGAGGGDGLFGDDLGGGFGDFGL